MAAKGVTRVVMPIMTVFLASVVHFHRCTGVNLAAARLSIISSLIDWRRLPHYEQFHLGGGYVAVKANIDIGLGEYGRVGSGGAHLPACRHNGIIRASKNSFQEKTQKPGEIEVASGPGSHLRCRIGVPVNWSIGTLAGTMKPVGIGLALLSLLSLIETSWSAEQTITARVTVYWRAEDRSPACWNGIPLQDGHCAVDPHKIPYGSKVVVDGDELTAVDTGPAVVSRKAARAEGRTKEERGALVIDRYFKSKEQAVAWARAHPPFMQVRVVSPDSSETVQAGVGDSESTTIRRFDWRWLGGIAALAVLGWPFLRMARRRV